ncbi:hypothetical protein P3T76_005763 [Phytophthora citrophthora]|uniref:Crinkler (CRN) family protein n=1 Tax=Phytophthora citrophthora TaxID=4793 RepID=A0AAD9GS16_9STRA|nr:hypothetical protein P3T76_005763 [Phytophthora citrophthora]
MNGYTQLPVPGPELRDVGLANEDLGEVSEEDTAAGLGPVNVLVQSPRQTSAGKRTRGQDWFVDDRIMKKAKVDGDEIPYFTMDQFPRMRDAYRVIYEQLMGRVKESFETRSPANLVVTGNPGTGKSWFYLYCIFQLILGNKEEVEELPVFDLVLNFDYDYQLYDSKAKELIKLNENEVDMLSGKDRVLRLVEGKSTHLVGWKRVSILFASPGLDGMTNYLKVDSRRYIMPVWTLEELQDYNSLLGDQLKVPEDVLIARYNKFGGIPRFIFCYSDPRNEQELKAALSKHSAMDIISYIRQKRTVTDENDRVFAMVPSRPDFRDAGHLDVLSNYVTEKVVSKAFDDGIQAVSEFALEAVDDSRYGSVREKMYEVLCHKWFELPRKRIFR